MSCECASRIVVNVSCYTRVTRSIFTDTLKNTHEDVWRCDQRKAKQCKYTVYVRNDTITRRIHEHTCSLPNPERNKALEQASWMKDRATSSREAPRAIIAQATADLQSAELAHLKSYRAAQRSIERIRKKEALSYAAPSASLADIKIPTEPQGTNSGQ